MTERQSVVPERLDTERLTLTRPTPEDRGELAAFLGDPRIGAWLGGTADDDLAAELLRRHIAHWHAHGFGLWIVRDRATGAFLGRGGLHETLIAGTAEVEAGWAISVSCSPPRPRNAPLARSRTIHRPKPWACQWAM